MFTLALAASVPLTMPVAMRGDWDLPQQCHLSAGDQTDGVTIKAEKVLFWEAAFVPRRILNSTTENWTALGRLDGDDINRANVRLNLRLSKDGKTIAYTNGNNRIVRLTRCGKK